jgi:hypothetical protein
MSDGRPLFLVCWDYGTGGVWGLIRARSEQEIVRLYPELEVVQERPSWMDDSRWEHLAELEYDIDGAPSGLLNSVLETRIRDEQRRGEDRPLYVVGYDDGGGLRWTWIRAHTETEVLAEYPELVIRHGVDPTWLKSARQRDEFDAIVHEIGDPPSGLFAKLVADRARGGVVRHDTT